ncbi:Diacetylchitobiose binding protein DasA [Thermoflexales bacterium]|nr:Diacetylchitobiose binding protein DasA [Thermoflexales bacterium]
MLELSIMNHGGAFVEEMRAMLQEFEQEAHIDVNLRVLEWRDAWAELVKVALYGDGPHVSEIGNTWLSEFVSMNALRPFVGMEVTRLGGAKQFLPSAWQSVTPAGTSNRAVMIWAVPWLADMRLIHYRQDIFERAGLEAKTAFQTPEALLQTCARLQAAGVANPIVVPSRQSRMTMHNLAAWVWGSGGDFTSPDGKKVLFALSQAKAGIYAYFDLARYLPPEMRERDEYQSDEAYWSGQAAMTISGPWLHLSPDMPRELAPRTRQVLPPGVPYIGGSHLVIWKHTRDVEQALALIRYLNRVEAQARFVRTSGLFPSRLEVLTHEPFNSDPFYQMAGEGLKVGRAFPTFSLWGLVENKLTEAFTAIWADILERPLADIHAIVDERLNDTAQRLSSTLAYY